MTSQNINFLPIFLTVCKQSRYESLQSNQVKCTSLDSINESIIWKLNPLVVSRIQIKIQFLIGLYEQSVLCDLPKQ